MKLLYLPCLLLAFGCQADWNGKRGWTNCKDAIAGAKPWPSPPCQAMEMCANEAQLTPAENASLLAELRHAKCPPP